MLDLDFLTQFLASYTKNGLYNFKDLYNSIFTEFEKNKHHCKNAESCKLECDADYKYTQKDGLVRLEVIVSGHNPNDVKVKWNDTEHVLKVIDETNVPDENLPWYYNKLNFTFDLPETTDKETFVKKIENGVLTVTVRYEPEDDTKAMPATEIEIQ